MKHILQKAGIGLGLMAASGAAFAGGANLGLHSFGDAMIYAKGGTSPLYASFIPSGNQSTDSVILVELTQGVGTAPGTWQYFVSSQNLGAGKAGASASTTVANTSAAIGWSITASTTSGLGTSFSQFTPIGNGSTATATAPNTSNGEILLAFSYSTSISSAASATCNVSFNAYVGTDDYMQYQLQAINASSATNVFTSAFAVAANSTDSTGSYTFTTKSAGATSDTVTGTGFVANKLFPTLAVGTSYSIPAYTYLSGSITGAAASITLTLGSAPLKQVSACAGVANARLALNSLGFVVGGKVGLIRLW